MHAYRCTRGLTLMVLTTALLLGTAGIATATPSVSVTPGVPGSDQDGTSVLAGWPPELRELVAGTTDFRQGAWFTDPRCAQKGGAPGEYMDAYYRQEKQFQLTLMAQANPEGFATLQRSGLLDSFDVFPNGNPAYGMREDICAADLLRWSIPDPNSVWGFAFTPTPDPGSVAYLTTKLGLRMIGGEGHGNPVPPDRACDLGGLFCARATWVNCDQATSAQDRALCQEWNLRVEIHLLGLSNWVESNKSVGDRITDFLTWAGAKLWDLGAWVLSGLGWVVGKVATFIGWLAKKGLEQVVAFCTEGLVWLWAQFTAWMVNFTSPNLTGGGFVAAYNLISGVMLTVGFLIWLAGLVLAWRRAKWGRTFLGALEAVLGIQLVGVLAYLMLGLSREATGLLIDGQERAIQSADFATSLASVNPFVGILAAFFGGLGLIAAFILLIFQVPMVFAHALFGTVAAAGRAAPATEHWLRQWFFKFLALVWTPFFMVGLMLLAQDLTAGLAANTNQNLGHQLLAVLGGLLIMIMMPFTPKLLAGIMNGATGLANGAAEMLGAAYGYQAATALTRRCGGAASTAAGAAARSGAGSALTALGTLGANLATLTHFDRPPTNAGSAQTESPDPSDTGTGTGPVAGTPGRSAATSGPKAASIAPARSPASPNPAVPQTSSPGQPASAAVRAADDPEYSTAAVGGSASAEPAATIPSARPATTTQSARQPAGSTTNGGGTENATDQGDLNGSVPVSGAGPGRRRPPPAPGAASRPGNNATATTSPAPAATPTAEGGANQSIPGVAEPAAAGLHPGDDTVPPGSSGRPVATGPVRTSASDPPPHPENDQTEVAPPPEPTPGERPAKPPRVRPARRAPAAPLLTTTTVSAADELPRRTT